MSGPSDSELLADARAGDRGAFSMLVDRHKDAVVNYLARMTGGRDRAEELAQETFVRLYSVPPAEAGPAGVAPWLYRVATNLLRSEERRTRRWRLLAPIFADRARAAANGAGGDHAQEAKVLADEARRELRAALAALPFRYRAPVVLREIQGLSYDEIAAVTGVPPGTVRSRISRGRALLKARLAPYWNGASR